MQLEKRSLPMEGACHITMEVLQLQKFILKYGHTELDEILIA